MRVESWKSAIRLVVAFCLLAWCIIGVNYYYYFNDNINFNDYNNQRAIRRLVNTPEDAIAETIPNTILHKHINDDVSSEHGSNSNKKQPTKTNNIDHDTSTESNVASNKEQPENQVETNNETSSAVINKNEASVDKASVDKIHVDETHETKQETNDITPSSQPTKRTTIYPISKDTNTNAADTYDPSGKNLLTEPDIEENREKLPHCDITTEDICEWESVINFAKDIDEIVYNIKFDYFTTTTIDIIQFDSKIVTDGPACKIDAQWGLNEECSEYGTLNSRLNLCVIAPNDKNLTQCSECTEKKINISKTAQALTNKNIKLTPDTLCIVLSEHANPEVDNEQCSLNVSLKMKKTESFSNDTSCGPNANFPDIDWFGNEQSFAKKYNINITSIVMIITTVLVGFAAFFIVIV